MFMPVIIIQIIQKDRKDMTIEAHSQNISSVRFFFGFCFIIKLYITELQLKHIVTHMPAPPRPHIRYGVRQYVERVSACDSFIGIGL